MKFYLILFLLLLTSCKKDDSITPIINSDVIVSGFENRTTTTPLPSILLNTALDSFITRTYTVSMYDSLTIDFFVNNYGTGNAYYKVGYNGVFLTTGNTDHDGIKLHFRIPNTRYTSTIFFDFRNTSERIIFKNFILKGYKH